MEKRKLYKEISVEKRKKYPWWLNWIPGLKNERHCLTAWEQERGDVASDLMEATEKEINKCRKEFKKTGKCKTHLIYDEYGWLYNIRMCGICGRCIGFV